MPATHTVRSTLLLIFGLLTLSGYGCNQIWGDPPVTVTFVFDEKEGLDVGGKAQVKGFNVGEISAIRLQEGVEVDVEIAAEHVANVHSDSFARIVTEGPEGPRVEIIPLDEASEPVLGGERMKGANGRLDEAAIRTQHLANKALEATVKGVERAAEAIGTHGPAAVGAAAEAAAQGLEMAREAIEENEAAIKAAAETARLGITETQKALENAGKKLQQDLENR